MGQLPVELWRPGINGSPWGTNTGESGDDLDVSLVQGPALLNFNTAKVRRKKQVVPTRKRRRFPLSCGESQDRL